VLQKLVDTVCRGAAAPYCKTCAVVLGVGTGRNCKSLGTAACYAHP